MVGARTEAGPTAAAADTRMAAVRMEAVDRTVRAAEGDILVRAVRVAVARTLTMAGAAEGARRDTRRRRGRVAARTEARRHASREAIRQGPTAPEAMGARVEATAAHPTARVDRVMAAEDTETLDMETRAATVDLLTPEITDRMAARDKADRTAARSKVNEADRTATHMATAPRRVRVTAAAAVTDRLRIAAILR
jgi:hypothetical protein